MRTTRKIDSLIWGLCLIFLVGIGLIGSGCGQRTVSKIPPGIPTTLPSEEEARRIRKENAEAIPIVPQGEREVGTEDVLPPELEVEVEQVESDPVVSEPPVVETRYGYRVQVFATSNEGHAQRRADEFRQQFSEKIYVDYEGLLYKVRVGDCVSRDDARVLRKKAVKLGVDGAFVIQTQIKIQ